MKSPVLTIHSTESVAQLAKILKETNHGAFPVLKKEGDTEVCHGLITRCVQ